MTDQTDIHIMLGRLVEGQENIERGLSGINKRIDESVIPVIEDYKRSKHTVIGGALAVSAIMGAAFGGMGKALAGLIK